MWSWVTSGMRMCECLHACCTVHDHTMGWHAANRSDSACLRCIAQHASCTVTRLHVLQACAAWGYMHTKLVCFIGGAVKVLCRHTQASRLHACNAPVFQPRNCLAVHGANNCFPSPAWYTTERQVAEGARRQCVCNLHMSQHIHD